MIKKQGSAIRSPAEAVPNELVVHGVQCLLELIGVTALGFC